MSVILDSSAWLAYFTDGPKAKSVEKYLRSSQEIFLPSIVSYEVYKKIKAERGEQIAVMLLAQMERLTTSRIPVDQSLAVKAADASLFYKIPMADAFIYAAALHSGATVITMDAHFKGLSQAIYLG